jgi:hypothetical protein
MLILVTCTHLSNLTQSTKHFKRVESSNNSGDGGFLVVSYDKIENETCNEQIVFTMVYHLNFFDLIYILRTKFIVINMFSCR